MVTSGEIQPFGYKFRFLMSERCAFSDLRELFAKANEEKSVDPLAGLAARSEQERVAAKEELANLSLAEIVRQPLIDPDDDEVTPLLLETFDHEAFRSIQSLAVGEFREHILDDSNSEAELKRIQWAIVPETAALWEVVDRIKHSTQDLEENKMSSVLPTIPLDDPKRSLTVGQAENLPHIGLVGDTYTITVTGEQTAGQFCVVDMHIPPGGGPPPHRHDFEETLILLEGQMEATFRGKKSTVRAGETLNIPANAPHQFHNASGEAVRFLAAYYEVGSYLRETQPLGKNTAYFSVIANYKF